MLFPSTISRRLTGAFAAVLLLFGIADYAALTGMVETQVALMAMLTGAILIAIGVGLHVGRSITRPMAILEEGAVRLASGDLSTRIELNSRDEFGRLAYQFNRMTVTLKEHQMKLLQSERLAAIGRFAAGVAHEINNPLGVILGYVRVIRKSADPRLDEDLRIIEDEAVRCQEIVEGLLDLARPAKLTVEGADLRAIADQAVLWLRDASRLTDITLSVEGDGVVAGNPQKLWQVAVNLLKNAAEAAGPGGTVKVRIQPEPMGQVMLCVSDSGPGLSCDASERLFEPFYTTKPDGTGLGLAVSRAIVQSHGGTLLGETSPAGGAVFTIRLPAWIAEAA